MKLTGILCLLASYAGSSYAFAPEMFASRRATVMGKMVAETLPNTEAIDRSLVGLDDTALHNVFDPTAGNSPAVARNNNGEAWVKQRPRPRRNRKSAAVRAMVRENIVTPSNFIYPLFIHDDDHNTPIPSMPGCERHSLSSMMKEIGEAWEEGVQTFILFPKVADELKTNLGVEAYNPDGIVPRAIRMIKEKFPDSVVCTDVALDPYSDQGHDGVVENGKILNDVTITQLCKQAVMQARAGADIVAPSDMMVCSLR
jgi:porphobilinogen synthase